jgi:hypothetical protein
MALTRRLVGWLLVFDDSQGFVDVVEFERESDARLAYRDLQHPMVRDAARGLTEANTCSLLGCGSCRILPVRRRQVCRVARALVGVLPRRGELTGGAGTRLSLGSSRLAFASPRSPWPGPAWWGDSRDGLFFLAHVGVQVAGRSFDPR